MVINEINASAGVRSSVTAAAMIASPVSAAAALIPC